jgi:hypothetical protein
MILNGSRINLPANHFSGNGREAASLIISSLVRLVLSLLKKASCNFPVFKPVYQTGDYSLAALCGSAHPATNPSVTLATVQSSCVSN